LFLADGHGLVFEEGQKFVALEPQGLNALVLE
jgi:hypothetical protein